MLLAQLVKAVMEGMANAATPMPAPAPAPIIPTVSEAVTATNDVVQLVCLVKSMREMGCEPYSGEQNAEVAGRWIRKVEKTMIQIKIPHGRLCYSITIRRCYDLVGDSSVEEGYRNPILG
jgi:hypothetical protein